MQINARTSICPNCGSAELNRFPVLHHMICAYVGPEYDFDSTEVGYTCPKCRRDIIAYDPACEIVGTSARCPKCNKEMVAFPTPLSTHEIGRP